MSVKVLVRVDPPPRLVQAAMALTGLAVLVGAVSFAVRLLWRRG